VQVSDSMDLKEQDNLIKEMKLMMHLGNHINVLKLLGVLSKHMEDGKLYAVLEYCQFGSLKDYILRKRQTFRPQLLNQASIVSMIPPDPVPPQEYAIVCSHINSRNIEQQQ
jgi:serine/threonine protein kinase